jgi:membrane protease YdiL (CAAX protease family)
MEKYILLPLILLSVVFGLYNLRKLSIATMLPILVYMFNGSYIGWQQLTALGAMLAFLVPFYHVNFNNKFFIFLLFLGAFGVMMHLYLSPTMGNWKELNIGELKVDINLVLIAFALTVSARRKSLPIGRPAKEWLHNGAFMGFVLILMGSIFYYLEKYSLNFSVPVWPDFLIWSLYNLGIIVMANELLFRKFIINSIIYMLPFPKHNLVAGILISTIFYSLQYILINNNTMVGIASLTGILYSIAYLRFRNIMHAIALHFAVNAMQFICFTA